MDRGTDRLPPRSAAAVAGNAPGQAIRKALLAIAVVLAIAFLLIGGSRWPNGGWMHESIEWAGLILIGLCILGRMWCTMYIGGRKNRALVTVGPYSVSRNPLYVFSIIGAVGVGAQVGSLLAALVCGFIVWAIFLWTALREEAALSAAFANSYHLYVERVPRFLPKFSLWQAPATLVVEPRFILATFFDALVFLIAIPLAEGLEYLHDIGSLPAYLLVP